MTNLKNLKREKGALEKSIKKIVDRLNKINTQIKEKETVERSKSRKDRLFSFKHAALLPSDYYLDEPRYTDEEVERLVVQEKEAFILGNLRKIIQNPKIIKEESIEHLKEALRTGFKSLKKTDPLKVSVHVEGHYGKDLRDYLPEIDVNNIKEEEILKEVLYRLTNKARTYWQKNEDLSNFEQGVSFLNPGIWELAQAVYEKNSRSLVFPFNLLNLNERVEQHFKEAIEEIEQNISFNWDNFIEIFFGIPVWEAYGIYTVETDSFIWTRRQRVRTRNSIIAQLSKDKPIIEMDGQPVTLNREQANYLKVLAEAKEAVHYLEIWKTLYGENSFENFAFYKEKAQPSNVFRSKPKIKKRFIENTGRGYWKFRW